MKKLTALVLALVFALSVMGCLTETVPAQEAPSTELEDTLVIYSTHPEDLLESISDAFTEKTGVKVEFSNLKGELADRVRSEKENPQADIMFGGDTATYMVLDREGCFAEVHPSWADQVADAYKDPNGHWYGTYRTPMVFLYNTEILNAETAPADWSDLAKPEYKDMIVTRDSLSSSMRSTVVSLIQYGKAHTDEETAWKLIEALNDNIKNYYNSGSMMFQAVGKGEAAISMAVINDCIKNRDKNGLPIEMVIPASGAVVITDCIAAIENAPHPNAAAAFIEFVGSEECQKMNANDFNRMPITDSFLSECPAWMQTEFTALDVDWEEISVNQAAWLEKWETDYLDADKKVASN